MNVLATTLVVLFRLGKVVAVREPENGSVVVPDTAVDLTSGGVR